MNMINVQSSRIKAYGYDPATQELVIDFHRGAKHAFKNVPPETVEAMAKSESIGRFFGQVIQGQFQSQRIMETNG